MTFIVWCAAAWRRWDEWRARVRPRIEGDRLAVWWTEPRLPPAGISGVVTPTALDLADIAPRRAPQRPGQRYEGKHRRIIPNEPIRKGET